MSAESFTVNGLLKSDGTLVLDTSPPLSAGRVRVTLHKLPVSPEEESLDWADLDYAAVPLKRAGQAEVRIEQRGSLKPMAHELDKE